MSQPTLLKCFEEEHLRYTEETSNKAEMQKASVKASSKTTQDQKPPAVLVRVHSNHWIKMADNFLALDQVRNSEALKIGAADRCAIHVSTEADVVHLANRYLIEPLLKAINTIYGGKLVISAESAVNTLRPDCVIRLKPQIGEKVVMVVEYKRCGYIHYEEFEDVWCEKNEVEQTRQKLRKDHQVTTLGPESNALSFVKQATAYRRRTDCKYVALRDYDSLVLLHYLDNGDLKSVDVTTVPRQVFRKALLGFLIEACQNTEDLN
jgi:hypothetical protein